MVIALIISLYLNCFLIGMLIGAVKTAWEDR